MAHHVEPLGKPKGRSEKDIDKSQTRVKKIKPREENKTRGSVKEKQLYSWTEPCGNCGRQGGVEVKRK